MEQINYTELKALMAHHNYAVSEGEGWTAADSEQFRTFSHFVLGVPHSESDRVLAYPAPYADLLRSKMAEAFGSTALPNSHVAASYASATESTSVDAQLEEAAALETFNAEITAEEAPAEEVTEATAADEAVDMEQPVEEPAAEQVEELADAEAEQPAEEVADEATEE